MSDVLQVHWDVFLQRLDDELQQKTLDGSTQVKYISPDTRLTDARTGEYVIVDLFHKLLSVVQ